MKKDVVRRIIVDCLKFFAATLNTVSLAFLVVGFVNPFVSREKLPFGSLHSDKKLEDLGLELFNPGVNLNWLFTALGFYVVALIAIGEASALDKPKA